MGYCLPNDARMSPLVRCAETGPEQSQIRLGIENFQGPYYRRDSGGTKLFAR